jgi:RND family efflux transporter MFP subunit
MAAGSDGKSLGVRVAISLALIVFLLAAGVRGYYILLAMRKQSVRSDKAPPRTAVSVERVTRSRHQERLTGYGRARALRQSVVDAEVGGVIRSLAPQLEAGATVAAGAELVKLDAREYEAAVARAEARLKQAQAGAERQKSTLVNLEKQLEVTRTELDSSRRERDRLRDLARSGHASQSEYDEQRLRTAVVERSELALQERFGNAEADLLRAEAEIAAGEADVATARLDLERTVIRAPYAGEIVRRDAQIGSRVAPGEPLFEIVDTSRIEVPLSLPASRFGEVRVGAHAAIRLTESGRVVWEGGVARVSPGVNSDQRTFRCFLVVEAASRSPVPPGAFVVATVDGTVEEDVIVLPRAAFVGDVVYVAEPDGEQEGVFVARERRPKVRRMLPSVALVEEGLEVDEEVLVSNVEEVADGTRVRVIRLEPAER